MLKKHSELNQKLIKRELIADKHSEEPCKTEARIGQKKVFQNVAYERAVEKIGETIEYIDKESGPVTVKGSFLTDKEECSIEKLYK